MKKFLKSLYLHNFFFYSTAALILLFLISYFFLSFLLIAQLAFILFSSLVIFDLIRLYRQKEPFLAERIMADRLSNGDDNAVMINLVNNYPFEAHLKIIDEIPFQYQKRDFEKKLIIKKRSTEKFYYYLRPVFRGEYSFGAINIYASSPLRLIKRKLSFDHGRMVPVYPSYLQLKKYQLIALTHDIPEYGLKRVRKIGNTFEFDQIRKYFPGDDTRSINWKATARKNELMVNQYQDERSQHIYNIIDSGRAMKMPFEGLSLLDYAVNSSLVISSIAANKYDKPGIITFSKDISFFLKADQKKAQMQKINEALYKLNTGFLETDFSILYNFTRFNIRHRSLFFIYTNFETLSALDRQLEYLRLLSKNHLVVLVFFKNTELDQLINQKAKNIRNVYSKIVAENMEYEKRLIVKELNKYGILSIYTEPENLTINVINKYLEIKAKRML